MSDAPPPDDDHGSLDAEDVSAAEYALGVLDREERARAESRSQTDPAYAREIFEWVVRLSSLVEAVAPVEPSSRLWTRIERAVAPSATELDAPAPVPANDAGTGRVGLWRAWATAASAIAAAALLFIAVRPAGGGHGGGGEQTLVATLGLTEGGGPALTVAYDPNKGALYASPDGDFSIPRARAAELWLIPADGKPRPMGLIDPAKPATMPMPLAYKALAKENAKLALSIEPPGGSKTGLPTGPVVASGALLAV